MQTNYLHIRSFATLQMYLFALLGLVAGIVYAFGGLALDMLVSLEWMNSSETPGLSHGTFLAFGALVGMPLLAAVIGFFMGVVEALLYNVTAKWFGGVSIIITRDK